MEKIEPLVIVEYEIESRDMTKNSNFLLNQDSYKGTKSIIILLKSLPRELSIEP